ncbi:efflux RND transporter periplasmic adaptor subunit [Butyrivibrio sp. MC2013]|uniref:efflux RND transporter periplasmic adaptor subunit n=1 Tax=Butyrivibrio sp. MC2013 TaxID=1280686 RepID=UPI00041AB10D|nr:HlyD family efflux transporter periplasmic adaptor subunit [Butyrivibrio sp. MC2013]
MKRKANDNDIKNKVLDTISIDSADENKSEEKVQMTASSHIEDEEYPVVTSEAENIQKNADDQIYSEDDLEEALDAEAKKLSKKRRVKYENIPDGMTRQEYITMKRKDKIKNFTILFLVILLLLTFFSNTIRNMTLPMVATAYVQDGRISPQIRGSGTADAGQPYNVVLSESRTIELLDVKVGSEVKAGDTICTLEDSQSTELTDAENAAQQAKDAYELAMFDTSIPAADVQAIRAGGEISLDSYITQMGQANSAYNLALKDDTDVQAGIDMLQYEKTIAGLYVTANNDHDNPAAGSTTMSDADIKYQLTRLDTQISEGEKDVTDLSAKKEELLALVQSYTEKIDGGATLSESEQSSYISAQIELDDVIGQLYVAESKLNAASDEKIKLTDFGNLEERNAAYYDGRIESENQHKKETALVLENATRQRDEILAKIKAEIGLISLRKAYTDAKDKADKLKSKVIDTKVTAPQDGVITAINYHAGETVPQGETLCSIQLSGTDITVSFNVSADQARKVKVGMEAQPQNAWYYDQFKATLISITNDPENPSSSRRLNFKVECPDIAAGDSVSLTLGEQGADYDMVVPNSAIKEDNSGKFILIIESRNSPLGNRYIARRADIQVLASDDINSAISGSFENYSYVITTASGPVKSGDQVRLSESDL